MAIIFFFIDGIGIGKRGKENPLSNHPYSSLQRLSEADFLDETAQPISKERLVFKGLDACLDVEGLPQSGTGQTALFTGINASQHLGKHFGPFPHSGIKPFLKKDSIFHKCIESDLRPAFLNAYPPIFFERSRARNRWSCTTLMAQSAGLQLRSTEDVRQGKAITAEFFGDYWREKLGIVLPKRKGEDIAEIITDLAEEHDLILFEYYLTDKAGHDRDPDFAQDVLQRLDQVLLPLIDKLGRHTFILSSDHGNLENLSTKTHTRNPVPLFAFGPLADHFNHAESILDVTPIILSALKAES